MIFTLVGMPASGKSCMGRAIASKLKMRLLDGDRLIESITGRKLQEIIDEDGLEAFKKIEEEKNSKVDLEQEYESLKNNNNKLTEYEKWDNWTQEIEQKMS